MATQTPFQVFCYRGGEFLNSVIFGRRSSYTQSAADLSGITSPDFAVFIYSAITCFVVNWGVRRLFIEPLAARILPNPKKAKIEKFAQAAMEMIFYSVFFFFGYRVYYQQSFVWPSSLWWQGWDKGEHDLMDPDYQFFYILYAGRYFAAFVSVLMEHKRKDFVEMQVHHTVTVVLVLLSYAWNYNRVGGAVMFLLDCADPPLHIAKQFKYCSRSKKDWPQFMADRWFEIFAVTFIVSRDVFYPYVVWSCTMEHKEHFVTELSTNVCNGLLWILLVLQFYWTSLIFLAVYNQMVKGGIEDIRSDSEDEDEDNGKKEGSRPIARKKGNKKKD